MKYINKIRSFLIRLLAGKNISVILNTDIDGKQGIQLNKKYYIVANVNLSHFDVAFNCKNNTVTIENENLSIDKMNL